MGKERAGGRGSRKADGGGKNEEEEQEGKKKKRKDEEVEKKEEMSKEERMFPVGPHCPDMSLWDTRIKASTEGGPSMKDAEIQTLGHVGQADNVTQCVRENPAPALYKSDVVRV